MGEGVRRTDIIGLVERLSDFSADEAADVAALLTAAGVAASRRLREITALDERERVKALLLALATAYAYIGELIERVRGAGDVDLCSAAELAVFEQAAAALEYILVRVAGYSVRPDLAAELADEIRSETWGGGGGG